MTPPWDTVEENHKQSIAVAVRAPTGAEELLLLVARGARHGPTLLLIGGVHGDEFEGPASLWRAFENLETRRLAGTVVLIPLANPGAYRAGERANPSDGKDLARAFPGCNTGTVTERIAYEIHHMLLPHCDFLCDLHGAGSKYRIEPWAGYMLIADADLLARQREAALSVGYERVWGTPLLPGRSLSSAAELGVPALYLEATGEGRVRQVDLDRNAFAIEQLLRVLRMVSEPVRPTKPVMVVEDNAPAAGHLQGQCTAPVDGYFEPACALGEFVREGNVFGRILDPAGHVRERIAVPQTGRLVFLRTFPVVKTGESLGAFLPAPGT